MGEREGPVEWAERMVRGFDETAEVLADGNPPEAVFSLGRPTIRVEDVFGVREVEALPEAATGSDGSDATRDGEG